MNDKRCCHYDVCRYVHSAQQYGEECTCENCIHRAYSIIDDDLISKVKEKRMSYTVASERYREGFNDALSKVQSMLHSFRGVRR